MISSEIRDFLRGPFYASQPIAKLNFKLSIPVGKQTDKNTGKSLTTELIKFEDTIDFEAKNIA